MTTQGHSGGKLICRICLDEDGATSPATVQHPCINEHTGKEFDAFVCARCLENGRETRVTCRTFVRPEQAKRPDPFPSTDASQKREALLRLAKKR